MSCGTSTRRCPAPTPDCGQGSPGTAAATAWLLSAGSFTTDAAAPVPPVTPGSPPAALRVVATAKLYDGAVGTSRSPSLAPLAPKATARLHPNDLAGARA